MFESGTDDDNDDDYKMNDGKIKKLSDKKWRDGGLDPDGNWDGTP